MSDRTNISLNERAYDALDNAKRADESFSDVVLRLTDGSMDHTQNTRIDAEQAEEIARMAGRFAGNEVEDRLARR